MKRVRTGAWLFCASLAFWVSWLLMPGVGVTDPALIFELVGGHRAQVFASVVLQLLSTAAYVVGAFDLALTEAPSRKIRAGCILLAVGAAGSAADAIFHLVAYEMTAPEAPAGQLLGVMARLQGPDLVLLLPFILAFLAGHAVLAAAFRRRGISGANALRLLLASPLVAFAFGVAARAGAVPKRVPGLAFLGLVSASLVAVSLAARSEAAPPAGLS